MVEHPKIPLLMDNIVFSLQKAGGASVYWSILQSAFEKDEEIDLHVLERRGVDNVIRRDMGQVKAEFLQPSRFPLRFDQIRKIRVDRPCIFHSSCYRVGKGRGCINVTTVHDFTCMRYYTGLLRSFSFWQIKQAVRNSDGIICISESTKRDLLHYIPEASSLPIEIIYHSYDNKSYRFIDKPRKKQVVFIGARGVSYKNFKMAVESVASNGCLSLIIIGAPLSFSEREYLESNIPGRFDCIAYPSAQQVSALFQESLALLYLSEYEGFGIPVLEGMASGVPVIASNSSSIPEVGGDAAILLDRVSAERVSAVLERLMNDQELFLQKVSAGLRRANMFSWEESVSKTKKFYQYLWDTYRNGEYLHG